MQAGKFNNDEIKCNSGNLISFLLLKYLVF